MKKLERSLSLKAAIAISVSAMLGSGIFVLPGLAMAKTGPSVWIAYLLASLCVLPAALSKAELATAMPTAGGTYVYVDRAFGPLIGAIAGFGLWLSLLLKGAFALEGCSAYLQVVSSLPAKPVALVLLSCLVLLNLVGVTKVGQAQLIVMALVLLSLLLLIIPGLVAVNPANFHPLLSSGAGGLFAATGFVFVSYAGVTKIAAVAEEVKDPSRNLPRAIFSSLVLVTVLYGILVFVMVGVIPAQEFMADLHPVYTLARRTLGPTLGIAAALLGVITLTSMANSGLLAASRFPFAMSRDKLLPSLLRSVHHRFKTPVYCILLTGVVMSIALVTFDVERIAKLASAFTVLMFMMENISVIVLRETAVQWYKPTYRSPIYPWIQFFGILSGVFLLFVLGGEAFAGSALIVVLGVIVYAIYGRSKKRQGVLQLYGRRAFLFLIYERMRFARKVRERRLEHILEDSRSISRSSLSKEAAVVVPLLGNESSSEMLIEMGAALAGGRKVEAVHISEVPDQIFLDASLEEEPFIQALDRRIKAIAEEQGHDIEFDAVVTHDLVESIHSISDRMHCRWLVMCWEGRSANGLLIRNPVGWLVTHLSCNLGLFRDAGVRYIRQILIYLQHGPNDQLVLTTAHRLADIFKAQLTLVSVVPTDCTEEAIAEREEYIKGLCSQCRMAKDLCPQCRTVSDIQIVRSDDGESSIIEMSALYDLVVTGAPPEENLLHVIMGTGRDRLTSEAACSVLRLTKPRVSSR